MGSAWVENGKSCIQLQESLVAVISFGCAAAFSIVWSIIMYKYVVVVCSFLQYYNSIIVVVIQYK